MACRLADTKPLSEPVLEYCWLETVRTNFSENFSEIHAFSLKYAFENVCEMAAILSRGGWVNFRKTHVNTYASLFVLLESLHATSYFDRHPVLNRVEGCLNAHELPNIMLISVVAARELSILNKSVSTLETPTTARVK